MKKTVTIFLCILLFLLTPLQVTAAQTDENCINARSAILMDMNSGKVLYSHNEKDHLSPASVTKIMSILLVLESIDSGKIKLTDKVTASANAVSMGGSQIWLEVGEIMTVEDLLKAVVVASANDACTVLGEYVGGSSTGFVKMMNDRAGELGLENTHFENCTGLDDTAQNHYSCAYDLAVIASEVMKHDIITDYTKIWLDSLRDGKTELNNTNKLVNTYDGITGLKTGTTSNAGFCVCATATRDNMDLVAVVLGSETSEQRFETASYLLDWGFANYETIKPEIDDKQIKSVRISGGAVKSIVPIYSKDVAVFVEKNNTELKYKYNIKSTVKSPVTKGQLLGNIDVYSGSDKIATIALVAPDDIDKLDFYTIFTDLLIKI